MGIKNSELNIILQVKDKATAALNNLNTKVKNFADSFKRNWLGVTAAITAGFIAMNKAWGALELAANLEQQETAFRQLAASHGASADQIIEQLRRVSNETLTQSDIIATAGRAMLLGLAPENLPRLMEIARASARITGQTITQAFDDISTGIGRQSKLILDNLGIIISAEDAYDKYAAAIGKTAAQLTDVEKKQAFTNAVIAAGEDILKRVSTELTTNAERLAQVNAKWRELGEILSKTLLGVLNAAAAGLLTLLELLVKQTSLWAEGLSKIPFLAQSWKDSLAGVSEELDELGAKLRENADAFGAGAGAAFGINTDSSEAQAHLRNLASREVNEIEKVKREIAEFESKATQGINNLQSHAETVASVVSDKVAGGFFNGFGNATGNAKTQFTDFARSTIRNIAEMTTKMLIFRAVMAGLNFLVPGLGSGVGAIGGTSSVVGGFGGFSAPSLPSPTAQVPASGQGVMNQFIINATDADSFKNKIGQSADVIENIFVRAMNRNSGPLRESLTL